MLLVATIHVTRKYYAVIALDKCSLNNTYATCSVLYFLMKPDTVNTVLSLFDHLLSILLQL